MKIDKIYLNQVKSTISDILRNQIDTYFDGNPTPENIKLIQEYVNKFLFNKFIEDGYRFELELECEIPSEIKITGFRAFKNDKQIC